MGVGVGAGVGDGPGVGVGAGAGGAPGVAVPDWSTVNRRPAMSIVAERAPPAFGWTTSSTVRLPDPVAIDGLTQDTGLDTFHAQPAMAVIATCTRPPSPAICAEDRLRSKRQLVASWFTVTRAPLRTIAPERATGASLAATVTVTWASPWPASGLSATQVASVVAFQEHSRAADTVACTLVPVAGTDGGSPLRFVAHFTGVGPVVVVTVFPPHPAATHATTHPSRSGRLRCTTSSLAWHSPVPCSA